MKKIKILLLLFIPALLHAQDYNVSLIPDSLKENANAVKRFEELHIIIKGVDKAVVKRKYAITILNEAGAEYARYENTYDKLHSLSDIDGNLYDAGGKKLKNVKKKDIADASYDDEESLVTDTRFKRHNFYYSDYPYTVEYEDEQDLDGIFFLDGWTPVEDEKFSVQKSNYIVETPLDYDLRYKQFNYPGSPSVIKNDKVKIYSWSLNNVKAIEYEPFQPSWRELTTNVMIAPEKFSVGGYSGDMVSWLDLGKFVATLNNGRDELPENVKKDVHALTDNVTDPKEKIKILYNYMQKNTRYIGVQLGIGSWQPFDAKYVAAKKYGDCKALSNYMRSLLKEANIKANYVLINSGDGRKGLWDDFPAPYFNHAIMCVPQGKDTIWLECTNQTVAPGYMGSFTGSREALLIADDGGHVVKTPFYKASDNTQVRVVDAKIDAEGNLNAEVNTKFTGIQQELQHSLINDATKEQREKYLNRVLNLPTYKIDKADYKEDKELIPVVNEDLHIISTGFATISGKRLFIRPNLFNQSNTKFTTDKPRKFDIEYTYAYRDIDSINIEIPDGYSLEALPKNASFDTKFGVYKLNYEVKDNMLKVARYHARESARFPVSDYNDLVKFYNDMYKADRSQVVFVKKE